MLVTLEEWASRTFSRPPKINTLRRWAKNSLICPKPELVGRQYQVEESAQYVPLRQGENVPKLVVHDPIVEAILRGTEAKK